LPVYTLDTCAVIARIKPDDDYHKSVVNYLSGIIPRDVKILYVVYNEVARKLREINLETLKYIQRAIRKVAEKRGVNIEELDKSALDEIQEETFRLTRGRHEGFYKQVFNLMKGQNENPYLVLSTIVDMISTCDQDTVKNFFSISDPVQDCLVCVQDEYDLRKKIKNFLKDKSDFFSNQGSAL